MFNFLNPKIQGFGIDLSDLSIKIVNLKKKGNDLELVSFGRQEIPVGLIENGGIKKEGELIEIIKKSVKEVKGETLKTKYCVVSLPETESFVRLVSLPLMKKEEVAEAIKWEIEANIPLGLPEIYYDWRVVDLAAGHQDHLDVLIGVLPKKTVDPYLNVLKKANLKPLAFEIESLAIARALVPNGCCEKTLLLIDIGAKKTSLVIFSGQTVYFTASLPISNSSIIATLSEKIKIDVAKAKQIKIEQGLDYKIKCFGHDLDFAYVDIWDYNRLFLDYAKQLNPLSDMEKMALEEWARVLELLKAKALDELVGELDWVTKRFWLKTEMKQFGFGIDSVQAYVLCREYHNISPSPQKSLFALLDEEGLIRHLVSREEIERARFLAPATRARSRGEFVQMCRRYPELRERVQNITWEGVCLRKPGVARYAEGELIAAETGYYPSQNPDVRFGEIGDPFSPQSSSLEKFYKDMGLSPAA